MAKNRKVDKDEGVDLSTAAEMWSEDELRELIREEALKLLMGQSQQQVQQVYPNVQPNGWVQPIYPTTPQWTQPVQGSSNQLYDGHSVTYNNASGTLVGASS